MWLRHFLGDHGTSEVRLWKAGTRMYLCKEGTSRAYILVILYASVCFGQGLRATSKQFRAGQRFHGPPWDGIQDAADEHTHPYASGAAMVRLWGESGGMARIPRD